MWRAARCSKAREVPRPRKEEASFTDDGERAIAEYLEAFGRKVSKNPQEGVPGAGRQGDAYVDGVVHEFKTLDPGAGPVL